MMVASRVFLCFLFVGVVTANFKPLIARIDGFTLLRANNRSALYKVNSNASDYDYAPLLIDLLGSRYQMGYDYG